MPAKKDKAQELFDSSKYGHFYVPEAVVQFLINLVQPKTGEKVLSIGFYADSLNLLLGDKVISEVIGAELPPPEKFEKLSDQAFDVILCAPAFGEIVPESSESSEEMWLKWSIDHLSENGRLATIVPLGLLSNYSQEAIRSFLVDKGGLEAVIETPGGWALGSLIQASILYITTNVQPERIVKMFRFLENSNIPWDTLANAVQSADPDLLKSQKNLNVFTISASRLSHKRLDAKYYDPAYDISPLGPPFEAVKLLELVDIRSGERFSEKDLDLEGVPFIKVKNISSDGTLNLRGTITIKARSAANSRGYSQSSDVLISISGTVGKVAIVPSGIQVCIDTSLRRLRVQDKSRILPEYLTYYLQSDIAKRQIEQLSSGSVVKVLSTPNLEQIIIYLPDLKKQQEIVKTYQNLLRKHSEQILLVFPNKEKMTSVSVQFSQPVAELKPSFPESPKLSIEEIIKTKFPFPIARAFSVFKASVNESPVNQIKKLINVSESVVYCLYGILVADQLRRTKSNDPELQSMFLNSISDYSIDRRIKYILRVIKLNQEDQGLPLFCPGITDTDMGVCSEIHNKVRNVYSHADLPEAQCKKLVKEYRPKIEKLLKSIFFIRSFRLMQVTNVVVRDGRPQHHIMTMIGDNSVFPTQVEDLDSLLPADTQHIILLDEDYNVLDLHPFYVIHAWESTGMRNQLCFLKQVTGQHSKQRLKIESTEGAGETDIDMDLQLSNFLS